MLFRSEHVGGFANNKAPDVGLYYSCGGGEIRTHDPVARIPLFKSGALNHSSHSSMLFAHQPFRHLFGLDIEHIRYSHISSLFSSFVFST